MCLKSKQLILNNILKLSICHNVWLSVISSKDAGKNALMLGIDDAITRANSALIDLQSMKYNSLNEGLGV